MPISTYNWTKELRQTYENFYTWVYEHTEPVSIAIGDSIQISGDLSIPENIDIVDFYNGAGFIGAGNLTIGCLTAKPRHQIFTSLSGNLNVSFGYSSVDYVIPEWFGSGNGNVSYSINTITPLSKIYVDESMSIGANVSAGKRSLYVDNNITLSGVINMAYGWSLVPLPNEFWLYKDNTPAVQFA